MAENLENSTQSGKKPTSKTVRLTPEMLLEIFQAGLVRLQQGGIDARVVPMFGDGQEWIEIRLYGIQIIGRRLVLVNKAPVASSGNDVAINGNPSGNLEK